MEFDIRTIALLNLLVNIISVVTMGIIWFQYRKKYKGLFLCFLNMVFQAAAFATIVFHGYISEIISVVIADYLNIAGAYLFLLGLKRYFNKKSDEKLNVSVLIIYMISIVYFWKYLPDMNSRLIIFGLTLIYYAIQSVWLLFVNISQTMKKTANILGISCVGIIVITLIRITPLFIKPIGSSAYFKGGQLMAVTLAGYMLVGIFILIGFIMMITRRLLEENKAQEEKYGKIFNFSPIAMCFTEYNTLKISDVNEQFLNFFGYSREEMIGKKSSKEELNMWQEEEERKVFLGEKMNEDTKSVQIEEVFLTKNGEKKTALISKELITFDGEKYILIAGVDITKEKELQKRVLEQNKEYEIALRKIELLIREKEEFYKTTESRLNSIINAASTGFIIFSEEKCKATIVNKVICSLLGYSEDELLSKSVKDIDIEIAESTEKGLIHINNISTFGYDVYESKYRCKNGDIIEVEVRGVVDRLKNEYIVFATDLREKKKMILSLQNAKEEAEQLMLAKEDLLLSISHDLRTPLNGIVGMSELGGITESVSRKNEYFSIINSSAKHLNRLVGNILNNNSQIRKEDFGLKNLVDETKQIFEKKCIDKGLDFYAYSSIKTPDTLNGDYNKLKQIVFNLVENALKYTYKGGIFIGINTIDETISKSRIEIEIKDTGIGIAEENLDKIFNKFYKESELENTNSYGIGLFNVKSLLESMNGRISLKSKKNVGSSFKIEIDFDRVDDSLKSFNKSEEFEIVLITEDRISEDFFAAIARDFSFNHYIFNSISEYFEMSSEIKKIQIVFISEDLYLKSKNIIYNRENIIVFGKKLQVSKLDEIKHMDINKDRVEYVFDILGIEMHLKEKNGTIQNKTVKKFKQIKAFILEDNELNIRLLSDILDIIDVKYDVARNIKDGIQFIKNNTYNIILSDLNLEEATGIDFISSIQDNINKDTVKVVITATLSEKIREKCFNAGFDEFVEKPFEIDRIIQIFDKYFSEYSEIMERSIVITDKIEEYYKIFIEQLTDDIIILRKLLKNEEYEEIMKIAHKIKGGAGILKEQKIVNLLYELEDSGMKRNSQMVTKIIDLLQEEGLRMKEVYK